MRGLIAFGLTMLWLSGCGTMPFKEVELVTLGQADPEAVRTEFARALPAEFLIVTTVTFQFRGQAVSAIGYTEVDATRRTFTVVALHPAGGLKLFEVSGNSTDVECAFAIEELSRWGDLAGTVAEDTRRMYFDRVPAPEAQASKDEYRIRFRQRAAAGGELEYVFAGADRSLIAKRYYEEGRKVWSASYYEYRRANGKLYPAGILLEDHRRRYRLVVRLKEIRS